MTPININTLFADIIDTPEQRQEKLLQQGMTQGRLLSSNLTGLARAAAPLAQMAGQLGVQRNEDLRRGVQPMLGIDPRTTGEKVQEQIQGLDPNDPNSMLKIAQALQSIDPVRAASLRQLASQKSSELAVAKQKQDEVNRITSERSQQRTSMIGFIDSSALTESEKEAYKKAVNAGSFDNNLNGLIDRLDPDDSDRYKVVGNNIWDNTESKFIIPNSEEIRNDLELSPKDYDPASIIRFNNAYNQATTDEERQAVAENPATMPLPVPDNGWSWQAAKDGETTVYVARPTSGEARQTVTREFNLANSQANKTNQEINNTYSIIGDIRNAVEGKEVNTILGKVTSLIPGTDAYVLDTEINALLSNLGFNALQSARAAAANGASGFGQLTTSEMDLLKSLISPLKLGLPKEEFLSNLAQIENFLKQSQSRLKDDWNMDSWIGLPSEKQKNGASVKTNDELMELYGE